VSRPRDNGSETIGRQHQGVPRRDALAVNDAANLQVRLLWQRLGSAAGDVVRFAAAAGAVTLSSGETHVSVTCGLAYAAVLSLLGAVLIMRVR
jgi:hypothetical protein